MNGHPSQPGGVTLADLPKSHTFTAHLPSDPVIPSPEASKSASPQQLRVSRPVKNAIFTWVAPEKNENPQLLATSWKAVRDLGLDPSETETQDFLDLMSGNKIYEDHYPWGMCVCVVALLICVAQNYGGWQFGVWASQLGDGRAVSLFEGTNPETSVRYEVQLKGGGKTPYSRFA
jgi:serine/tyrosine/threonine adenylyltransferase